MRSKSYLITDYMSDHYPCVLSYVLDNKITNLPELSVEKKKLSDESIAKIQQGLLFYDWSYVDNPDVSVDDCYMYLVDAIEQQLNEHAPKRVVKIRPDERFVEPWISVSIKRCNRKSRHLCKKAKQSGLEEDLVKYKTYRNTLNRVKLFEKKQCYGELFTKIGKNAKMMWEVMNNMLKKCNNKTEIVELCYEDKNTLKKMTSVEYLMSILLEWAKECKSQLTLYQRIGNELR